MRAKRFLWIIVVGGLAYGWAITFDYAKFDDDQIIEDNLQELSQPASLVKAFTGRVAVPAREPESYYRPIVTVSYVLDTLVAPHSPHFAHATNVVLHLAVSCLVWLLLVALGVGEDPAFALALIFAAHPLASNVVGWIPGRNDSLLALFVCVSFLRLIAYLRGASTVSLVVSSVAFVAALLAKEAAVGLLPMAGLYAWGLGDWRKNKRRVAALLAALTSVAVLWGVLHTLLTTQPAGARARAALENLSSIPLLWGKAVIPVGLSPLPVMRDASWIWAVAATLVIGALLLWTENLDRRRVGFGVAWFVAFLAPSVFSRFDFVPSYLECRAYVPLIGVLLVVAQSDLVRAFDWRNGAARELMLSFVLMLIAASVFYAAPYRSGFTLWEDAVHTSPDSPLAHGNLGAVYVKMGRVADAEREFRAAVAINPSQPVVRHELGAIHYDRGELDAAETEFRTEIAVNPRYAFPYQGLGGLAYRRGNPQEAISDFRVAVGLNPRFVMGWQSLAVVYATSGDVAHTKECVTQLRSLNAAIPSQASELLKAR